MLTWLQWIGSLMWGLVSLLVAFYFMPHSPLRRAFEKWIDNRVKARFDEELEQLRHRLQLEGDRVRINLQRQLHDAVLFSDKKHEVYRELFRQLVTAQRSIEKTIE